MQGSLGMWEFLWETIGNYLEAAKCCSSFLQAKDCYSKKATGREKLKKVPVALEVKERRKEVAKRQDHCRLFSNRPPVLVLLHSRLERGGEQ